MCVVSRFWVLKQWTTHDIPTDGKSLVVTAMADKDCCLLVQDKARFDNAVLLLLYNVEKQNQWSKEEKLKIKAFIYSFIHDFYFYTR